jgi:hypothetical protein
LLRHEFERRLTGWQAPDEVGTERKPAPLFRPRYVPSGAAGRLKLEPIIRDAGALLSGA